MVGQELTKELTEKVYQAIENSKNSVKKGSNEVTKTLEKGKAKLVAIASDVSPPEIVLHLPLLGKEKNIPVVQVGTKEELGAAAGLGIPTSAVAVMEASDALINEIRKVSTK